MGQARKPAGIIEGQLSFADILATISTVSTISTEKPEPEPEVKIEPHNYRITDFSFSDSFSPKQKFADNIAAIRCLKNIETEDRPATADEQEILARYVGWGGLADAFDAKESWSAEREELKEILTPDEYMAAMATNTDAFFTSPVIIRGMYAALEKIGFKGGNVLDPSMGTGNFFGAMPESMQLQSRLFGVEIDPITGRIAQKLYPDATVYIGGFQETDRSNFFDLVISNVPFGALKVNDRKFNKFGFSIHNYFFAKALDQVRPGGIVAFITSSYTLDSKNSDARKYIAERAELMGAIRLPNSAFKGNAGTSVVTDIIFLKKREKIIESAPFWVETEFFNDVRINKYFLFNQYMVLGSLVKTTNQFGREVYDVVPLPEETLETALDEAISYINGTYVPAEIVASTETESSGDTIPADPDVKNFSFTLVNGSVYYRQDSVMRKVHFSKGKEEGRVKALIELREKMRYLIDIQMSGCSSVQLMAAQSDLSSVYDDLVREYGNINSRNNSAAFSDDASYYLLCSLERMDEEDKKYHKADIFFKRTIRAARATTSVETPSEALAVSMGELGRVDIEYMAALLGTPGDFEKITGELTGVIFKDPITEKWLTADEYLSGNVREKLRVAEAKADEAPEFWTNVKALKKVQPKDLTAAEIDISLGAVWIDPQYIKDFIKEIFKPPIWTMRNLEVIYSGDLSEWQIYGKKSVPYWDENATLVYGTKRLNAYEILERTLNLKQVVVYDYIDDTEDRKKRVLNSEETVKAQEKQQLIKDTFRSWILEDSARRQKLVGKYNELYNSIRPREYDGKHLVFPGMNPEIKLYDHQLGAVAHALYGGNALLAHEVGAGKTYEMVAIAMESKRLGLCTKSLFVVPNHLVAQWGSEFLRLYPGANILIADKKSFKAENRKKLAASIVSGDWDAIIIGFTQFDKIELSPARLERYLKEEIEELTRAIERLRLENGWKVNLKRAQGQKKSLEEKLERLTDREDHDDVVTLEELGIDRLFVDEAHYYKNLYLQTKMGNVAGVATNSEVKKTQNFLYKCRYIDEITESKGLIFATGTPVSNSMPEIYTMQRYLQHDRLKEMHLEHFDAWVSIFGELTSSFELAPEGTGYRLKQRLSKFHNLPELMSLFKEIADIKTADQLNIPVPDSETETICVQPTSIQRDILKIIGLRAEKIRAGSVDRHEDNMLKVTNDGRKLGLDQRLIDPLLPDDPSSKVNACIENILRIYFDGQDQKLTQLVFCDLSVPKKNEGEFSVYNDVKTKLIARGVGEKEIAFIHDAKDEKQKEALFSKVRVGEIRILLGSTAKMGTGANVQERLVAIHHLDVPWRPSDMIQRNGRILRQGNGNDEVQIYQYVTEATFDAYMYQVLEQKQKYISQIMTSKDVARSYVDDDEQALSYAEVKALCAGDPLIKERMELEIEVSKLKVLLADYLNNRFKLEDKIKNEYPSTKKNLAESVEGFKADLETARDNPVSENGSIEIVINGKQYTNRTEAGKAIIASCKRFRNVGEEPIGHYRGFELILNYSVFDEGFVIRLKGNRSHMLNVSQKAALNISRMDEALSKIPEKLEQVEKRFSDIDHQIEVAKAQLDKPFEREEEYTEKVHRLEELNKVLNLEAE